MGIKNTLLGGADFSTPDDRVKPTDLNDTFNAAAGFLTWCGKNFNDVAQMIFNADYLGYDSRLKNSGVPSLNNVLYSTFQTDDADTNVGFSYNSTTDLYEASTLGAASLIFKEHVPTCDNAVPVINYIQREFETSVFTNYSFEDVVGAEWVYSESEATWSDGGRVSTTAYDGTYSYLISSNAFSPTNSYAEISQTVDLSDSAGISFFVSTTYASTQTWTKASILVDGVVIGEQALTTNVGFQVVKADIPESLRASGKSVSVRITTTNGHNSTLNHYIDFVRTWKITPADAPVLSITANGGLNWEEVDNAEFARLTSGTELWRKIEFTIAATGDEVEVTEQAVKYNVV